MQGEYLQTVFENTDRTMLNKMIKIDLFIAHEEMKDESFSMMSGIFLSAR